MVRFWGIPMETNGHANMSAWLVACGNNGFRQAVLLIKVILLIHEDERR